MSASGSYAAPELASLPLFHRVAGQKVLVLGEGAMAEPKRRLVERAGGIVICDIQRAVDEGVRIAFIAFEDSAACEAAAINLRCAGLLVNVVDRPDLCDFTTPSILDRNPLLVAIGTGGASAGLAKHVRLRLEQLLPPRLGELADALFAARATLRSLFPNSAERRRVLDEALAERGPLDPMRNESVDAVAGWLANPKDPAAPSTHKVVVESDDPELLTVRAARLLGMADTIVFDAAIPAAILARARADAVRLRIDEIQFDRTENGAVLPDTSSEGLTVILRWKPAK